MGINKKIQSSPLSLPPRPLHGGLQQPRWLPNVKYIVTIRFQLILPVDSHNVTKNLTGHRMHVAGPQICQFYHWNNNFQNMYGML